MNLINWTISSSLLLLVLFQIAVDAQGIVICDGSSDQTSTSDWNPLTNKSSPFRVLYPGYGGGPPFTSVDPDIVEKMNIIQGWSDPRDATVILSLTNVGTMIPLLTPLFKSEIAGDIALVQSPKLFDPSTLLDLGPMMIKYNLTPLFSPTLLAQNTINGVILGLPDRHVPWGFWYRKSIFNQLNLSAPKTWNEFLAVCKAIKASGKVTVPIAFGGSDNWLVQTYFTIFTMRLGGVYVYDQFTKGQIAIDTHPILGEVLQKMEQLFQLGYFKPKNTTGTLDFVGSLIDVAFGPNSGGDNAAMTLATPAAELIVSKFGLSYSDYGYFPFPTVDTSFPDYARPDTSELITSTCYVVNAKSKQLRLVKEFMLLLASPKWYGSVNKTSNTSVVTNGGSLPAQLAFRNSITNPEMAALYNFLDGASATRVTLESTNPEFIIPARPLMQQYGMGLLSFKELLSSLEAIRQETQLGTAAIPVVSPRGATYETEIIIALTSLTMNATIQYSLVDISSGGNPVDNFVKYQGPFTLFPGRWRLRTTASRETGTLLKKSANTEDQYAVALTPTLAIGDVINKSFAGNIGFALAIIMWLLISWLTATALNSAKLGRSSGISSFWASAAVVIVVCGLWAAMLLAISNLEFAALKNTGIAPHFDRLILGLSWIFLFVGVPVGGGGAMRTWRSRLLADGKLAVRRNAMELDEDDDEDNNNNNDDDDTTTNTFGSGSAGDKVINIGDKNKNKNNGDAANGNGNGTATNIIAVAAINFLDRDSSFRSRLNGAANEWIRNRALMGWMFILALSVLGSQVMTMSAIMLPATKTVSEWQIAVGFLCSWQLFYLAAVVWIPRESISPRVRITLFLILYTLGGMCYFFIATMSWQWKWSSETNLYTRNTWTPANAVNSFITAESIALGCLGAIAIFGITYVPFELQNSLSGGELRYFRLRSKMTLERRLRKTHWRTLKAAKMELYDLKRNNTIFATLDTNTSAEDLMCQMRLPQWVEFFEGVPERPTKHEDYDYKHWMNYHVTMRILRGVANKQLGGGADSINALANFRLCSDLPSSTVVEMRRKLWSLQRWINLHIGSEENVNVPFQINIADADRTAVFKKWAALPTVSDTMTKDALNDLRKQLDKIFSEMVNELFKLVRTNTYDLPEVRRRLAIGLRFLRRETMLQHRSDSIKAGLPSTTTTTTAGNAAATNSSNVGSRGNSSGGSSGSRGNSNCGNGGRYSVGDELTIRIPGSVTSTSHLSPARTPRQLSPMGMTITTPARSPSSPVTSSSSSSSSLPSSESKVSKVLSFYSGPISSLSAHIPQSPPSSIPIPISMTTVALPYLK